MGIFAFLKSILPEQFIKVESNTVDNRKIIVTNSTLQIGNNNITEKAIIDQFFEKLAEDNTAESLPFQLLHKDLVADFIEYQNISLEDKNNLKLLKQVLPQDEVECILMARRVSIALKKNEQKLASDLRLQLERNYPKNGKKVLNLVTAKYFDEMILPFVEVFKSKYGTERYVQEFRTFYIETLRFFPIAVFVGNLLSVDGVTHQLQKRLILKDIPFIRLHAIGQQNIEKIEASVNELGIGQQYSTKSERFTTPSGLQAIIYEIKIKN